MLSLYIKESYLSPGEATSASRSQNRVLRSRHVSTIKTQRFIKWNCQRCGLRFVFGLYDLLIETSPMASQPAPPSDSRVRPTLSSPLYERVWALEVVVKNLFVGFWSRRLIFVLIIWNASGYSFMALNPFLNPSPTISTSMRVFLRKGVYLRI